MISNCQIKIKLNIHMNFDAGIRFIVFLIIFGVTNYLMMLRRYENEVKKKKYSQQEKISKLYPKGSFTFLN